MPSSTVSTHAGRLQILRTQVAPVQSQRRYAIHAAEYSPAAGQRCPGRIHEWKCAGCPVEEVAHHRGHSARPEPYDTLIFDHSPDDLRNCPKGGVLRLQARLNEVQGVGHCSCKAAANAACHQIPQQRDVLFITSQCAFYWAVCTQPCSPCIAHTSHRFWCSIAPVTPL